jgi:hypothetical protein
MSPILTSILLGLTAAAANVLVARSSCRRARNAAICDTSVALGAEFMPAAALKSEVV